MRIYVVPVQITGFDRHKVAIRVRKGESPVLFMKDVVVALDGYETTSYGKAPQNMCLSIMGDIEPGISLQDGDCLLVQAGRSILDESVELELEEHDGAYLTKGVTLEPISMAACMEDRLCAGILDTKHSAIVTSAVQLFNKAIELYKEYPAFQNIMIKNDAGEPEERTLIAFVMSQTPEFIKWAETMILSMDSKYKTQFPVAKQILERSVSDTGFTLLTKEEQVAAFLEFSKRHADTATELVPDKLINYLKESSEYAASLEKIKKAGLGLSSTQQFNVLQQVGYFGGRMPGTKKSNVIYNLSDMGAGKTLMTVQAIHMLDCIKIGTWNRTEKNPYVEVTGVYLPDKHIIAPALSVKSSWVDTFRLFYDVERKTDFHYILRMEYDGVKSESNLYIAPFTVRGGKVFVQETLPEPASGDTYLIVDEIHQLVRRRISRTKFFVPKITPVNEYQIFALSGTMSNLKAGEWLYLIRFLGDTEILQPANDAKKNCGNLTCIYRGDIEDASKDVETIQHRKFNVDNVSTENIHVPVIKKKSIVEENYFMQYGSKLIVPSNGAIGMTVQDALVNGRYTIGVEPEESDNVSFELFYRIAATSAITAQSLQIAEELFGEQATQHKSSIIKTMSPFTDEEVMLLDALHKIAADANKYRSPNIGREINNAILNLNDGLQQKDLYTLVSGFAERNTKFLEYLAGLDVNVLERLPKTSLIRSPKLEDTHKFRVLKELLEKDKDETFLIVVNDFYAMKSLAEALGVSYLSKQELKDEMAYQELLDGLFEKQSVVIVTQDMIKSSLDLVQANRLVQYQLNTEVSDIIQTQNRINRIGQTRETKCFYIAADRLQNTLIELFLDSYRNIRVAHKGIVELFADLSSQIDVINDFLDLAFKKLGQSDGNEEGMVEDDAASQPDMGIDLMEMPVFPKGYKVQESGGICSAILFPEKNGTSIIVPLRNGSPFKLGLLRPGVLEPVAVPTRATWNLKEMKLVV